MKTCIKLSLLITVAAIFAGSSAHAQTLLSVNINDGAATPSGFSEWNLSSLGVGPGTVLPTATFGSITLTLNASSVANEANAPAVDGSGNLTSWGNGVITRNRATISTTSYGGMYQDFATAAAGGAVGLQISGLSANTAYSITFYSFDENGSRTSTFTDYTGGADIVLGSITYSNPSGNGSGNPTFDSEYSLTTTVTTDSSGRLTFAETEPGNAPVLDGFQITEVPEPGSLSLLLAGLGALMTINRFRAQGGRTRS